MARKKIAVTCDCKDMLPFSEITEFQGGLKIRDDAEVEKMAKSIKKYGFSFPFFIWAHDGINYCLDGHGRLLAVEYLMTAGYDVPPLPVVYVSCKDEDEARNKLLRLNSQYGRMTVESVMDFVSGFDVDFADLELPSGVIDFAKEEEEAETEGDDDVPEADERQEPDSQPGEMYELGNSILMCGDSTNAEDVERLMGGEKADLVFTDPPYGMKKESEGVLNDNLNFDDLLDFNKKWIPLSFEHLKENGSWYCWGMDEPLMDIYSNILKPMAKENKITFRNLLTWDKGDAGTGGVSFMGMDGLRSFPIGSEKCLFVMCGVQGFNNNSDHYDETFEPIRAYMEQEAKKVGLNAKQLKDICGVGMYAHWFTKSQFGIIPQEHYEKLKAYYSGQAFTLDYNGLRNLFDNEKHQTLKEAIMAKRAYFNNTHDMMTDVWAMGRIKHEEKKDCGGHATPKPIALCERAIKSSSRENEVVLDLFGGSGSTLIACEKNGRKARLMELDPHYCDVIRMRYTKWAKENGKPLTSGCLGGGGF